MKQRLKRVSKQMVREVEGGESRFKVKLYKLLNGRVSQEKLKKKKEKGE